MTVITADELEHVLKLAHLDIKDSKKVLFLEQLTKIFGHMEELNKLDLAGVSPISHAFDSETLLREDVSRSQAVPFVSENAPQWENGCFYVPKILEG